MHDVIEKIMAYMNSKFSEGGDTDSLGREKPFFNVVIAARNIWYRATDIDRKNIAVTPSSTAMIVPAFIATVHLQDWMKRARFGTFLNDWGRTLATYGSAVVKFVIKKGILIPSVIPWNRLILDPQQFDAIPTIEKLYYTPSQLRREKNYNQDVVEKLINARTTRKTIGKLPKDSQNDFIEVYEVHGEMSKEVYNQSKGQEVKEGDDKIFFEQVHIVSYVGTGRRNKSGYNEYEDYTLYSGKEARSPYMITHLIEEDGRTLGIGAVEHLFDAQWMQNHTMKNMKDTLDLASKLVFQTADPQFLGKNVLTALETGDIFTHKVNMPLTQVNTYKADIQALINFSGQWKVLGNEINGISESMLGKEPPSGTAWRLQEALLQESHSLFEIMIENKANALEDMLTTFIIPHLKDKMDTKEEIMAVLQDHDIKKIDAMYIPRKAVKLYNENFKEMTLNEQIPPAFDQMMMEDVVRKGQSVLGNTRSFEPIIEKNGKPVKVTWSEVVEDLEWKLDINISGEAKDKGALLTSLTTTFQTIASLAGRPMTPDERLVFNKIMNESGAVSPIELSAVSVQERPMMPAQTPGGSSV